MQNPVQKPEDFNPRCLSGRNRRLLNEWIALDRNIRDRQEVEYVILRRNPEGLPTGYRILYRIRSISGVEGIETLGDRSLRHPPRFSSSFQMDILIPDHYPGIDAPVEFRFLCKDGSGHPIPHPWHPNIRYFGDFAGRVCLNAPDTFSGLAWGVDRVALYLRYELYHAWPEPPYPEDGRVAEWVVKEGEPEGWVFFDQD